MTHEIITPNGTTWTFTMDEETARAGDVDHHILIDPEAHTATYSWISRGSTASSVWHRLERSIAVPEGSTRESVLGLLEDGAYFDAVEAAWQGAQWDGSNHRGMWDEDGIMALADWEVHGQFEVLFTGDEALDQLLYGASSRELFEEWLELGPASHQSDDFAYDPAEYEKSLFAHLAQQDQDDLRIDEEDEEDMALWRALQNQINVRQS